MRSKIALAFLSVALACACRARAPVARDDGGEKAAAAMAAAVGRNALGAREYRIAPTDQLSVSVYGEPTLDRKTQVDGTGAIYLPLAGTVRVGGLTLEQARSLIASKFSDYLVAPQVSLFIDQYGSRTVFVMGEVQKPGSYPMPPESRLTVLEAISMAGGFTPVANAARTRVLRAVGGKSVTYAVDARAITGQGQEDKDLTLEPNDVVYVPQSLF